MGEPVFGFELECLVPHNKNAGSISTKVGRWSNHYDSTIAGGGVNFGEWLSSIFGAKKSSNWSAAEFVSPIFKKESINDLMNPLMEHLGGKDDDLNGIKINSSCGAHIHFSWRKNSGAYNMMDFKIPKKQLKMVREMAEGKIMKTLPDLAASFKSQYSRGYAKTNWSYENLTGHYNEFSFTKQKGVEWRSFNLQGVKNWKEIKTMLRLGCETITELLTEKMTEEMKAEIPMEKVAADSAFAEVDKRILAMRTG